MLDGNTSERPGPDVVKNGYVTEPPKVPRWMLKLGIGEGEWLHTSKPALKAGMTPRFTLKTRVWCCGILASHGYKGERCYTKAKDKTIPLTPALVAKQLHEVALLYYAEAGKALTDEQKKLLRPSRQHIRRALEALEDDGVAERRTNSGVLLRELKPAELMRLPSGHVRLQFFVKPHVAKNIVDPDVAKNGYVEFPGLSKTEARLLSRVLRSTGITVPSDVAKNGHVAAEASVAIRGYMKTLEVAKKTAVDRLLVAIKHERFEISSEIKPRNNNNSGSGRSEGASVVVVQEAFSPYGDISEKAAGKLIKDCRTLKPDCTAGEIVAAIHRLADGITRSTRNPIGMLLSEVPAAVKAAKPLIHKEPNRESASQRHNRLDEVWRAYRDGEPKDRELAKEILLEEGVFSDPPIWCAAKAPD